MSDGKLTIRDARPADAPFLAKSIMAGMQSNMARSFFTEYTLVRFGFGCPIDRQRYKYLTAVGLEAW